MKLEIKKQQTKIDQKYIDKILDDSSAKAVELVGGLKGFYNSLSHWGKIIDPQTMVLVAEVSTPIVFNLEHDQNYLPRFKQDYFTDAGYDLANAN